MDTTSASHFDRFTRARSAGFAFTGQPTWNGFTPKPGSHDDGPYHGPPLGGIGTGWFSRDHSGAFSRWGLQPGYRETEVIPQARILVRWTTGSSEAGESRMLGCGSAPGWLGYTPRYAGFDAAHREAAVLFPRSFERYVDPSAPVETLLTMWSPLVFGDDEAAALPVVFFSLALRNLSSLPVDFDAALFWPNLLGRRLSRVTTVDRGGRSWPGQTHSGNGARPLQDRIESSPGKRIEGVVQTRHQDRAVREDMEGGIGIFVEAPTSARFSREICIKADQNALGIPAEEQTHTQAWAEGHFTTTGELPGTEERWTAHWHEPISSAVHAGIRLEAGATEEITFLIVSDTPLTVFGDGRRWAKRYTRRFGTTGRAAEQIARHSFSTRSKWEGAIDAMQEDGTDAPIRTTRSPEAETAHRQTNGAVLNELFFVVSGGSAWVDGEISGEGLPSPRLGNGEHFAILEGFDMGYFYYNTFDLWVYAFPALAHTWPGLARSVFDDYLRTLQLVDERRRIVYRVSENRRYLVPGKIPHDLGNPMADPWHEINGYVMRDDPNVWRDHNPAFIAGYRLLTTILDIEIDERTWTTLKSASEFVLTQAQADGLPRHDEFGDSTWDALQLRGVSAYSGGLVLAAYAAIAAWAKEKGDAATDERYRALAVEARDAYERELWTGSYYRTDSAGVYRDTVMTDALFGPFLARLAGLGDLLPLSRVQSHLEEVYRLNFSAYREGQVGPLLINGEANTRFSPDGGEELQINEVLVGSAWLYVAMLQSYGLDERAGAVANALRRTAYERSGLQFRTPAAWDAEGQFRAPANMRPLSMWFLRTVEDRRAGQRR